MAANSDERSYKRLFQDGLWALASFVVPFAVDAAIGSFIFLGLLWFAWLIGLGRALGIPEDRLDAFHTAHFWINYGVFVGIGLSFGLRVLRRLFRGE